MKSNYSNLISCSYKLLASSRPHLTAVQIVILLVLSFCKLSGAQVLNYPYQYQIGSALGTYPDLGVEMIDADGNLYVGVNNTTVKLTHTRGTEFTQSLLFSREGAMGMDSAGNIYVADDQQIFKETPNGSGGYTESVFFDYASLGGGFLVYGIAVAPAGTVYAGVFSDQTNPYFGRIDIIPASGSPSILLSGSLVWPYNLTLDASGNLYWANELGGNIMKETLSFKLGEPVEPAESTIWNSNNGTDPAWLFAPPDPNGNIYFYHGGGGLQLAVLTPSGTGYVEQPITFVGVSGSNLQVEYTSIVVDAYDDLFFSAETSPGSTNQWSGELLEDSPNAIFNVRPGAE